jgi:hypothetical protein
MMLTSLLLLIIPTGTHADKNVIPDSAIVRKVGERIESARRVAGYLKGRLLGSFVREGMGTNELDPILGSSYCLIFVPSDRGSISVVQFYPNYGMRVCLENDPNGVLRVESITYFPLFYD